MGHHSGMAENNRHEIIQIMHNAAGHNTNSLEALGLSQLKFQAIGFFQDGLVFFDDPVSAVPKESNHTKQGHHQEAEKENCSKINKQCSIPHC